MHGQLIVYDTDGTTTVTEYNQPPTLSDLQDAVGGYIERVPFFNGLNGQVAVAFCNDDNKLRLSLAVNKIATELWRAQWKTADFLYGPIAVVVGTDHFIRSL